MTVLDSFALNGQQVVALLAVLAVSSVFAVIGGCFGGPRRMTAVDVFVGWGAATGLFLVAGVFLWVAFTWVVYFLIGTAVLIGAAVWLRDRRHGIEPANVSILWRILVLAAPVIVLAAAMRVSQWDEFTTWLPNAQYLLRHDSFPRTGLPASPVGFAGYPYGLPLITYLVSRLSGAFVENAGAMFNLLLLMFYAPILLDTFSRGLRASSAWPRSWGAASLAILGVTVFSTTFVQKLVLTSYADSATSVVFAVIGVLVWRILNALAEEGGRDAALAEARPLAWQCGVVIVVFVNLKQSNMVLLVLLIGGMALVALRDPKIRLGDVLRLAPVLLLPGAAAYLAWRYHVSEHLSGREFSFRALGDWFWADALAVIGRMFSVAATKGAYFAMMSLTTLFALRGLWRVRGTYHRLAILVAFVFVGYNVFLLCAYLGAFGIVDARRAGSYWRYNTQLGLLGFTAAAYGLAFLWRQYGATRLTGAGPLARALPALGVVVVLALPIALHGKLRFDARPWKDDIRLVGRELATGLPEGSKLAVVDPGGVGLSFVMMHYEFLSGLGAGRDLSLGGRITVFSDKSVAGIKKVLDDPGFTHAWVHRSFPFVEAAMGIELAPRSSHLLRRVDGDWVLARSWPYDGYEDPHTQPD